jgi:hypothetical protein
MFLLYFAALGFFMHITNHQLSDEAQDFIYPVATSVFEIFVIIHQSSATISSEWEICVEIFVAIIHQSSAQVQDLDNSTSWVMVHQSLVQSSRWVPQN